MKTKTTRFSQPVLFTSSLALLAASGALGTLGACSGEFKTKCPDGTVQSGGGDVNDPGVCKNDAGAGGAGGEGGAPATGSGGGGGILPVPPGGECNPNVTKCEGDAQQACGTDGKWGEAVGCEMGCDGAGKACVVPVQLALGTSHACARMSDGTVRCWGDGALGQLGNVSDQEQLTPKTVEGLGGVADIVVNAYNTCARLSDDTISCWGSNDSFALQPVQANVRFPNPMGVPGVESAALLVDNSCVLAGENDVLCKGQDARGGCGNGHDSAFYVTVKTFVSAQLPEPAPTLTRLFSGGETYFALADDGRIYCWGVDKYLGALDRGVCPVGSSLTDLGLSPRANIVGAPDLLAGVAGVSSVAASAEFACAVHVDGKITCWGANGVGQLGRGPTSNSEGPDPIFTLDSVQQAAVGAKHACAVTKDGRLFCWGSNSKGQLGAPCGLELPCLAGTDGVPFVSVPTLVRLSGVAEVRAGADSTCARTADSRVLCWGSNDFGQLGNGTKNLGEVTPKPVVWE